MRRRLGRALGPALVLAGLLLAAGGSPGSPLGVAARAGEDEPPEVPVRVAARLEAEDLEALGRWRLTLAFTPEEDVGRAWRILLRLTRRGQDLLALDHAPDPPTPRWRQGVVVRYALEVPVPLEAGLQPDEVLELALAFLDPATGRVVPPRTEEGTYGGRLVVARPIVPALGPLDDAPRLAALLERAAVLAAEGRGADAWRLLELGLRRAEQDATKRRFRDALLALGSIEPPPPSALEQDVVRERIATEKRRHLREVAGRCHDRGHLFAALRILEAIGGTLAEEGDRAVIGALAEARRTERDIQEIRLRILASGSEEDAAKAAKAAESLGTTRRLLEKGEAWLEEGAFARARKVFLTLSLSGDRELASEARERLAAAEARWLAQVPPEEAAEVEAAVNHPAFARLATVGTPKFLYIGPRAFVESIPPDARLRLDLACVFQTDLFGRLPNPEGDRITVFFKELWDFGGGQGGGKTIDIGRTDPEQRGYRVDTGLLYHELTHCVDDTIPIHAGWREGLANFGAAFTFEALGQKEDELHALRTNLEAFRREYLARDVAYWRIQNYGPSAGFFLHFADAYAQTPDGHDWRPYRRFFREYRAAPVADGRETSVARALAYYLVRAFGPQAFDDLLRFRLPLVESDREVVGREVLAFDRGEWRVPALASTFEGFPNSPLPRDLAARRMLGMLGERRGPDEIRAYARDALGILHDWWVIGPFRSPGAEARAVVFPPEREIDLAREYVSGNNACRWRRAGETGVVTVEPTGWVSFLFSYQDDTATYALTHVTVDEEQDAWVHVRADDDLVLFVNGVRVESYLSRDTNGSSPVWWRGPTAPLPDAIRLPVRLQAGRNRLLLKVKNHTGEAGFVLAVSRRDGGSIAGLRTDLEPAEADPAPEKGAWRTVLRHEFRHKAFGGRLETPVGRFKAQNGMLRGEDTAQGVPWRVHTVRPGFPKDAPSNLAWLRAKALEDLGDFRLTLDLVPDGGRTPKIVVAFQGEGEGEPLAGWALVLHPQGEGRVQARLERHEDLHYQTEPLELPPAPSRRMVLTVLAGRLSASLGDVVLFDRVPLQTLVDRHAVGFATWGPDLGVEAFELEEPARAR